MRMNSVGWLAHAGRLKGFHNKSSNTRPGFHDNIGDPIETNSWKKNPTRLKTGVGSLLNLMAPALHGKKEGRENMVLILLDIEVPVLLESS